MTSTDQSSDLLICPKCGELHAFTPLGGRIVACLLCGAIIEMESGGRGRLLNLDTAQKSGETMTEQSSYTGLPGSRKAKLAQIKALTNEELLRYYTLSCRSGEIEISLAGEWDFEQATLKRELEDRLRAVGFLGAINTSLDKYLCRNHRYYSCIICGPEDGGIGPLTK